MEMQNSPSQRRALTSVDRLGSLPHELIDKILERLPIRDAVRTSALSRFWRLMERQNSRCQRRALMSVDRLVSLPHELINKILERLPIRDAVRTSALSRFWRYRWTLIQNLVFDARSVPSSRQQHNMFILPDFISFVLYHHKENVSRFEISNYLDRYYADVEWWLYLLAGKSVKELILEFPNRNRNRQKIAFSLFSCQILKKLKLQGCKLFMPSYTEGFPSLVNLELNKVTFTVETIARLIVNCPLTRLVLVSCDGFNYINICAPDLKVFYIHGPCESVNIGHAPNLEYARMYFRPSAGQIQGPSHNGRRLNFKDVLGGLVNARELHLNDAFIQILVTCMVPDKLGIEFPHLSHISVGLNLDDSKQILAVVELLKSSPHLQTIAIDNCCNLQSPFTEEVSLQSLLQQDECNFVGLEIVALSGFKGRQYELSFLQYILLNAKFLQTMCIKWEVNYVPLHPLKSRVVETLMQFERASPIANVVFL